MESTETSTWHFQYDGFQEESSFSLGSKLETQRKFAINGPPTSPEKHTVNSYHLSRQGQAWPAQLTRERPTLCPGHSVPPQHQGPGGTQDKWATGALGPAVLTPRGVWKDPDHRKELGPALNTLKAADTHRAEEAAGGQQDAHVWCKVQKQQPEPGFLMGVPDPCPPRPQAGARNTPQLRSARHIKAPCHEQYDILRQGTYPATSSKGLCKQTSVPNTARHLLPA